MEQSLARLPAASAKALRHAAERIRRYHEAQKQDSWQFAEEDGSVYGQKVTPWNGGHLRSRRQGELSVFSTDACDSGRVAGVREIVATVPLASGAGADMVFPGRAGRSGSPVYRRRRPGDRPLAYGTETVPKVDKIAGPGNIYVTVAKKLVFGEVGIDMIAGPTELTVICDAAPTRTGSQWICFPRPNTTNRRNRS